MQTLLTDPRNDPGAIAAEIAALLHPDRIGTGALAALRRLDPERPTEEPALVRLLVTVLPEDHAVRLDDWGLIAHCLAIGAPELHRGGKPFGEALFDARYSESRLLRLLRAERARLALLLPRACRFLVAKGEKLRPGELARLVLAVRRAARVADAAEPARLGIARAYYSANDEQSRRK